MKFAKHLALVWALLFVGMGYCVASNVSREKAVQFETLAKGSYSGVDTQRFETIRDQQTLKQVWRLAFSRKHPAPTLPEVDFSEYAVMALFLGQKRTGGYGIKVLRIESHAKSLVVKIALSSPGKGCVSTQTLTQPFQIIKLPETSKEILFQTTTEHGTC